jgi:hypothetical protein
MSLVQLAGSSRTILRECFEELYAVGAPASLGGRSRARAPGELCELLLDEGDRGWADAFAVGLSALAKAQREAFPENIFGDLDYLAASVLRQGRESASTDLVEELFERLCALQAIYGEATAIRFRYVHDFTYGYDWAKWVRREPGQTGAVGPFDLEFLRYMQRRGDELLELIAADDTKYPTLRDRRHRNPFSFSREPKAERRLFPELATRGLIPVETWRADALPRCEKDFAALRVACASELGLSVEGAA